MPQLILPIKNYLIHLVNNGDMTLPNMQMDDHVRSSLVLDFTIAAMMNNDVTFSYKSYKFNYLSNA